MKLNDGLDPVMLQEAVTIIGLAIAEAVAKVAHGLCADDRIDPRVLEAALLNAHLLGAASAIVHPHTDEEDDDRLIELSCSFLHDAVLDVRNAA